MNDCRGAWTFVFFFFLIPCKKIQRLKRLCKSSATRVVIMEKL